MSLHYRSRVFGACLSVAAMLVAAPICAAPADFSFDVQEIGPQHSHIRVRLRQVNGPPVDGALVDIDAVVGPESAGVAAVPTMTQSFKQVRPGPGRGQYTIIIEPGMHVFALKISAEVPGETELVTADIIVSQ
jgi:hypothetical protein